MATDWSDKPLSEVCSYINRGTAPAYVETSGVLVLNQRCVRDWRVAFQEARRTDLSVRPVSHERMLRPLDIIVNSTGVGTLGRVAQIGLLSEPATVDSHVTIVRADPEAIDARFLGFAMRNLGTAIEALAEGSTGQTELGRARLAGLEVPVPPMGEQRAIARILGALDDKKELNRQLAETMEAIVRALFHSWFVDFDPVRAKAERRTTGLPLEVASLFPDRFEDSPLGEIPTGWMPSSLDEHINITRGLSYKGDGLAASGRPLHNLNSVREGGGYKYEGIKYYTGECAPRHVVCAGDVIVANTEQGHDRLLIGYAAVVPPSFGSEGIFSHHLYRVRLSPDSVLTPLMLCSMLNSRRYHDVVSGYANGTTVNMLPIDGLRLVRFPLPPIELVRAFDHLATLAERRLHELVSENRILVALSGELLPRLLSGQLRVRV